MGEARVTPGFNLPHAEWVVHTVAPLTLSLGGRIVVKYYERRMASYAASSSSPAGLDVHANQRDDCRRTDHSAALRARNAADVAALTSSSAASVAAALRAGGGEILLTEESITCVPVKAIVNAANETLEGGGGVDQAIHAAAGGGLRAACLQIPPSRVTEEGGAIPAGDFARCPVGEARVTPGFNLPHAEWVVHTVAPLLDAEGKPRRELLRRCYVNCLNAAEAKGISSLAFCALGTGFYGFPQVAACEVALGTTIEWLQGHPGAALRRVLFCMYGSNAKKIYPVVLGRLGTGLAGAAQGAGRRAERREERREERRVRATTQPLPTPR